MAGYDGRGVKFPLTIVRGADMAFELVVTSSDVAVDMSTATIAGEVYDASTGALVDTLAATVSSGSNEILLAFTDAETTALTDDSYTWTLWVTRGSDKRPWLAGPVRVSASTNGGPSTSGTTTTLTVDGELSIAVNVAAVGSTGAGTGDVTLVGVQTLTNKTLDSFTNTINADELHIQVRNDSGSLIAKGTPVYVSGYNVGQDLVLVAPADASSLATMPAIGLTEAAIANNANGAVDRSGRISGLNTSAYTVGDVLYVSETTGALTATRPAAPAITQQIATVLRSHASQGVLDVGSNAALVPATVTAVGGVELATNAETITGTDTERATTPAGVAAAIAAGGGGAVDSVNTQTGVVVLDADDIDDTSTTNKFATSAELTKLAGIETAATADQTAAEILAKLITVDGSGSGLDADLLDGNSSAAFATSGHNHTGTYQPLDADLTALAAAGNSTVLAATTASFLTADETKLDALDADLTTFSVPASTTISAYGATLVDDADAATARTTLGLGALAPKSAVAVPGDITATGTPSASTFLRGDGAWASPAGGGGGDLLAANNLSDVANAATSLSNLGGQPLDADLTALAAAGNSTVLAATTASFLSAQNTKLNAIEALADVTDTANVTAAGALMDSEVTSLAAIKNLVVPSATTISTFGASLVDDANAAAAITTLGLDADIATLVLPASTTISTYGRTLVDDADAATARTTLGLGTGATATIADYQAKATFPSSLSIALSDMTTQITTGTTKAYWVNPYDTTLTITKVKATLATAGSGATVVDINEGAGAGTSILSTKITIDASETDSDDATTPAVISDTSIAADGRLTFDIDTAGTSAAGLMVHIMFTRAV